MAENNVAETTSVAADTTCRRPSRAGGDLVRRTFDIVVSAPLLLIALPIIALTAIGSAVTLRAWPFFAQQRVGRDGRTFRFVKVRTLPAQSPAYVDKHQLDLHALPAFCQMARRLHVDELPQLVHVLFGQMSLVGPRPEMPHLHSQMPPDFAELRTSVRPGCTGLWQVSPSCADLIDVAPEYDAHYIANRTVRLDLWILYRTALKMTGLGRPVGLAQIPSWTSRGMAGDADSVIVLADRAEDSRSETLSAPATAAR